MVKEKAATPASLPLEEGKRKREIKQRGGTILHCPYFGKKKAAP